MHVLGMCLSCMAMCCQRDNRGWLVRQFVEWWSVLCTMWAKEGERCIPWTGNTVVYISLGVSFIVWHMVLPLSLVSLGWLIEGLWWSLLCFVRVSSGLHGCFLLSSLCLGVSPLSISWHLMCFSRTPGLKRVWVQISCALYWCHFRGQPKVCKHIPPPCQLLVLSLKNGMKCLQTLKEWEIK